MAVANKDADACSRNRFDPMGNPAGESLGDQALDKFQEWAQATWTFGQWRGVSELLDPSVVETETRCLLDVPYLWLRFGDALDIAATFEDWLVAMFACVADLLSNSDYNWILRTNNVRDIRIIALDLEGFEHPALQRAVFDRIKLQTQRRREMRVLHVLSQPKR